MEFPTAPAIKDALKNLVDTKILGYSSPTEEYFDATIYWMKRRHNFDVKKEWFVSTPGVIPALSILIQSVTKPGDAILLLTPVYYPFDMVTISNGRRLVYSRLINKDGRYEIDFDDLTEKAKMPEVKAILFQILTTLSAVFGQEKNLKRWATSVVITVSSSSVTKSTTTLL